MTETATTTAPAITVTEDEEGVIRHSMRLALPVGEESAARQARELESIRAIAPRYAEVEAAREARANRIQLADGTVVDAREPLSADARKRIDSLDNMLMQAPSTLPPVPAGTVPFRNDHEITLAMQDPRYQQSSAAGVLYREEVNNRIQAYLESQA